MDKDEKVEKIFKLENVTEHDARDRRNGISSSLVGESTDKCALLNENYLLLDDESAFEIKARWIGRD